jgi:alpha-1,6-mannosyltransferase
MGTRTTSGRAWIALSGLGAGYVFAAVSAGAPRSPLIPLFPAGAAAPGWTVSGAAWLGLDGWGRGALTVLALALFAGLVVAFAVVAMEAWRGRVGVVAVATVATVSLVAVVAGPLLLSRDVYSYAVYGRMFALYGANPYVEVPASFPSDPFVPVVSGTWLETVSLYGPAFTLLSGGLSTMLEGSPAAQVLAFKVVAAIGLALAALLSGVAAGRIRPERSVFAVAVVGLNPVLVMHAVGGGHNDMLVAAALAGAAAVAVVFWGKQPPGTVTERQPRAWPGLVVTALLALATLVKVVAAIALLVWVWSLVASVPRRDRLGVAAAHAGLAAVIAATLFAPFFAGWRTLTSLATLASTEGWASGPRLVARGARALGEGVGLSAAGSVAAALVFAAFVAAFAVALWRLLHSTDPREAPGAWGVALLLFALSSPYLIPWYAAWFLPLLPLGKDRTLIAVGLTCAAILALTGIPAEPDGWPDLWRGMLLAVHYVAAPIMLGLFLLAYPRALTASGWPAPGPARRRPSGARRP